MNLTVLVENNTLIDRYFKGEPGVSYFIEADGKRILFDEDSALVYKTSKGLVIITACSHAGICNIIEKAKRIFEEEKILDIIGGFHLQNPSKKQIEGTKNYLEEINPEVVHASHCTDLQSKIELAEVVNIKEVGVGLKLEY